MKRLSIALAAVLAVGAAHASPLTFEFGLPLVLNTTEIGPPGTAGNLGLFDTSLGTLTGATLTLFGGASFAFTGTNVAAQAQNASITSSTSLIFDSSVAALNALFNPINLSETSGVQSYAIGQTRSFGPTLANGQQAIDVLGIAALQAAGGGTFSLSCLSLSGLTVLGGGGNIATTQATSAGCGASITYTYTAAPPPPPGVPEPATLALVGLALAGASVATRRRRQG